jgi:hypothetical protein
VATNLRRVLPADASAGIVGRESSDGVCAQLSHRKVSGTTNHY